MGSRIKSSERDILVVAAEGNIDVQASDGFFDEIEAQTADGTTKVVLDCSQLQFISSFALARLVRLHAKLKEQGGAVKLAAVTGLVLGVFRCTGMQKVLDLHPTVDSARAAFGSEAT